MTSEVMYLIQACEWTPSHFLVFSDNVYANLIYYSHLGSIIPAILIALLLIIYGRREFPTILLVITTTFFSLWVFSDLVLWANEFPSYIMFFWALEILAEPLVYFFSFYFFYTYAFKKDFSIFQKVLFIIPLLPTFFFASTKLGLLGYDISNCDRAAVEGILATYGYGIEILYMLLIIGLAIFSWRKVKDSVTKERVILLAIGTVLFLLSFSIGNILEVFSLDWGMGQYGLFGAPIFVGFLAYLIVHYHAFNVRLIGAQVLVAALWLSVLALLFIRSIEDVRIVTSITLIFVLIVGIYLVRGVYREIAQRERIEKLAGELQETNERQEVLFHFIGHEVKGFLTKDANAFAALAEGDFGVLPEPLKPFVGQALMQARGGERSVTDILTASNLKKGTVAYTKESLDFKVLTAEAVEKARVVAEQKGLTLSFVADESSYQMVGDRAQISDHVLRNLIDNAINYTPSGSVAVSLKKENGKIIFAIKDSGIGITEEDKKHLFTEGGHGKDSQRVNAHSTGYGLYIAKNIILAHGGTIRAESEGAGKGSTFIVELPTI